MRAPLGQHFMTDLEVIKRICNYADLNGGDVILEVGAGGGVLTSEIAKSTSVTAIEKDPDLAVDLKEKFEKMENVCIMEGDALRIEFPKFNKCVSSIPYLISKKFLLKLMRQDFKLAVLILQKEVAEKIAAKPGTKKYGVLAVAVQSQATVKILEKLPKNVFKPQPKVESAIVRIERFKEPVGEEFINFITKVFQQRNKVVKKVVNFGVPKELSEKRVSTLSPEEFQAIFSKNG